MNKLLVGIDFPEYISLCSLRPLATEHNRTAVDLILIAFYYLLCIGKYTGKGSHNKTKQTIQFRFKDVMFFYKDSHGTLRQLPQTALDYAVATAQSRTLKLKNQKNGWKGVCIHQECNCDIYHCPVLALDQQYIHIQTHDRTPMTTFLSTYYSGPTTQHEMTDKHIQATIKLAAFALGYPSRGILIDHVDTHSLRSGGVNALALNGYSDWEIQKMGCWRSVTFKEYIQNELHCYTIGM
jgi:hypothetical protein